RGGLNHWVPVPLDQPTQPLAVSAFATDYEYVADVPLLEDDGTISQVPCFCPWTMAVQRVPQVVNATSNGILHWTSELVPPAESVEFAVERTQGWYPQVQEMRFYVHAFRSPITVRRYAGSATATVRMRGHEDDHVVLTQFLAPDGISPASVGVAHEV